MKKSALIIGSFIKDENIFKGKIKTLAIDAIVTLQPNDDKEKDSHPDYIVLHGQNEIGVAWNRNDDRGFYISIAFEEPSLGAGGLFWRRVTTAGVFAGMVVGVGCAVFLALSKRDPFFGLNAGFVALCGNFLITAVVSLLIHTGLRARVTDRPSAAEAG